MSLPYTVAILADIHGNLAALDAVLADLETQPHDALVLAGDLLANGPQPAETLARIIQLNAQVIYGNMDRAIVEAQAGRGESATAPTGYPPLGLGESPMGRPLGPYSVTWWAREQIGSAGVTYLDTLPLIQRITPPAGRTPGADLLIVHATPTSDDAVLVLTPEPNGTTFTASTPEDEAAALLGDAQANLIVYGHIHYFSAGMVRGRRLRSIGSVGFPFDVDQRAAYALAQWDGTSWQISPRRVPYDFKQTAAAIRRSGQPRPERYAQMILQAKWLPWAQFA